ncbi:sensor histidine kinase [Patiriisocius hiemis]|uniref:histidine kinase n=1 Tax=Patiriisocius hiemis TaxID=3075604 RepID=A0ABU2YEE3_9FLAO|nr:ATP-binding protein [Constantimarinum sp. W242]MDT0556548.1 ATP-binding protein [Constantimarinum sp. W242]
MDEKEIQSFLIIFSVIAVALVLTIIILFSLFQQRKNKLLREQEKAMYKFQRELIETQVEIREETLRNISWELHDNIGQLVTLAKIKVQNASEKNKELVDAADTIGSALDELRSLSKIINPDTFSKLSLTEILKLEIDRFNRLKYLEASLNCTNCEFKLNDKSEIIIFRILQEFFTNTIKHSKATKLSVALDFKDKILYITAKDNGVGFNVDKATENSGIGLSNIANRAKLINASVVISSEIGKGTELKLTYKSKAS